MMDNNNNNDQFNDNNNEETPTPAPEGRKRGKLTLTLLVFWFKNNQALNKSIYFSNGSTLGFIYAGGSSYNNGMQISSSDLSNLMSQISSGITFYVK